MFVYSLKTILNYQLAMTIRKDAYRIVEESIEAVLPEAAVDKALDSLHLNKPLVVVAIGKAAWRMARAASDKLGNQIERGLVVTKYGHSQGALPAFEILEAGHPVPDENSVRGATRALEIAESLERETEILFLISGGGSSIFELPLEGVTLKDITGITELLLKKGAEITELNTVRKHLSAVKGGRFALRCATRIVAVVLSDVIGDHLDAIASGPVCADPGTSAEAIAIIAKYDIPVSEAVMNGLKKETPKIIRNSEHLITGNMTSLCEAAAQSAEKMGYSTVLLSTSIQDEAKTVGNKFASVAKEVRTGQKSNYPKPPCAIIAGGESVVQVKGKGKGGRNQETALSAALGLDGLDNVVFFSVGSDGTDGPTDAAGGMVDGESVKRMRRAGITPEKSLENNDSYHALKASDDLIVTGPTGTNVNDLLVLLLR